jgi:L-iditol 2-dehydrogenase
MKQLVCRKTGLVEIVEGKTPVARPGELLVDMTVCGICGTDIMKAYDDNVAKPVQLGHEIVGVVSAVGAGVEAFRVGQRVAVAHHAPDFASHYATRGSETQDPAFKSSNVDPGGFAEMIRVPADLVPHTVHAIPDAMPDARAVFMEPLACCLRALDRVPVRAGDTVLVAGVGSIGLLFVPLLKHLGAKVIATDMRAERLALAKEWGAAVTLPAGQRAIADDVKAQSAGRGADLVILTVVSQATLQLALASVRDGGWIIPFGVKPETVLPVDLWQLYRREVSLVTSYSATPDGLKRAMALLASDGFAFESMISHVLPLDEAQRGFDLLHEAKASKVVIRR